MSVAEKTRSTSPAMPDTSPASLTTSFFVASGAGEPSAHRPATASSYVRPADFGLAATTVTSNHGCAPRSATKR
jgi:hypothetical protein